jgi:L-rhamnose mutarotase
MANPVGELLELTERMADEADSATIEQVDRYMERRRQLFDVMERMDPAERLDLLAGFPGQSFQQWESVIEQAMARLKEEAQDKLLRFRRAKQQRTGYDVSAMDTNSFFFDRKK